MLLLAFLLLLCVTSSTESDPPHVASPGDPQPQVQQDLWGMDQLKTFPSEQDVHLTPNGANPPQQPNPDVLMMVPNPTPPPKQQQKSHNTDHKPPTTTTTEVRGNDCHPLVLPLITLVLLLLLTNYVLGTLYCFYLHKKLTAIELMSEQIQDKLTHLKHQQHSQHHAHRSSYYDNELSVREDVSVRSTAKKTPRHSVDKNDKEGASEVKLYIERFQQKAALAEAYGLNLAQGMITSPQKEESGNLHVPKTPRKTTRY